MAKEFEIDEIAKDDLKKQFEAYFVSRETVKNGPLPFTLV